MFSTIWHFIKLIRYLLPFLQDVADESKNDSDSDKLKARAIKRFLTLIAWRILFIAMFLIAIFYYAIPLYSQNAVLMQEIKESEKKIVELETKLQKSMDAQYVAMGNTQTCNIRLETANIEVKRLQEVVKDLRYVEGQWRAYVIDKEIPKPKPKQNHVSVKPIKKPGIKPNSSLPQQIDKKVSDRINNIK